MIGLLALTVGLATAPARGTEAMQADRRVAEFPVDFKVVNRNGSRVACDSDERTYRVTGTMALPGGRRPDSLTLYLHGSGGAHTWNFTAVPGYDHIAEMARRGHASLAIDWLGYGASDIPRDGQQMCVGSVADTVSQIITAVRTGAYTAGPRRSPTFKRVALVGHSAGGVVAQVEAISFDDIDALVVAGWAEHPPEVGFYPMAARAGMRCATGGEPKHGRGRTTAYGYLLAQPSEFDTVFHNEERAVYRAFTRAYERDPCGVGASSALALAVNVAGAATFHKPVLLVMGDRDPFIGGAGTALHAQAARYRAGGNADVSVAEIPDSGHMLMLQRTAPMLRDVLSHWLAARGF